MATTDYGVYLKKVSKTHELIFKLFQINPDPAFLPVAFSGTPVNGSKGSRIESGINSELGTSNLCLVDSY